MTLIDHINSNLYNYECTSGNLDYPDSDHHANFTIFKDYFEKCTTTNETLYRRNIKNIDIPQLHEDFLQVDWNKHVFCEPDIDIECTNIISTLDNLLDKHAPLTKLSNRKQKYLKNESSKGTS